MKKKAKDLKKGNMIIIAGINCVIQNIEISEIGKHGKRKCRIEAKDNKNKKIVVIRPEDYPFEVK